MGLGNLPETLRLSFANSLKKGGRKTYARSLNALPLLPARNQVFILCEINVVEVLREWLGQLSDQLLSGGLTIRLSLQLIKTSHRPGGALTAQAVIHSDKVEIEHIN